MKTVPAGQPWAGIEAFHDGGPVIHVVEVPADYDLIPQPYKNIVANRPISAAAAAAAEAKLLADSEAARQYTKLRNLTAMSPAEVTAWVAANVTNLAQAQDAIATLAVAVSVLGRRL